MIQPVGNFNINFKGTPKRVEDNDIDFSEIDRMFAARNKARQAQRLAEQKNQAKTAPKDKNSITIISRTDKGDVLEFTTTRPKNRPKKKIGIIPRIAIPTAITLGSIFTILSTAPTSPKNPQETAVPSSQICTTYAPEQTGGEEIISQIQQSTREQEVKEAVQDIKKDPELSSHYYNMITTLQRLDNLLGDSTSTLEQILSEPWAQRTDIELLLPQIFYESSGLHYDENGTINTSSANCVGLMQISEDAQIDVNKRYFSDMPLDRNNPVDNIKLGIGLNQLLSENYFGDDIFSVLCSYNAGADNILKGNYLGSDIYANNILTCSKALKEHPKYTQMLLSGELDEYKDELLA